jgi:hypothetical protein
MLLDKAVAALPPKSAVRSEIEQALEQRKLYQARAAKAWETMRARKAEAEAPKPTPTTAPATPKAGGKRKPSTTVVETTPKGKRKPKVSPKAMAVA